MSCILIWISTHTADKYIMYSTINLCQLKMNMACQMAGSREEHRHSWHNRPSKHYWHNQQESHALFGHDCSLTGCQHTCTPSPETSHCNESWLTAACSGMNWIRSPGRPRKTPIQHIGDGTTTTSWRQTWPVQRSVDIGESSQWTTDIYALRWWWWWWWKINIKNTYALALVWTFNSQYVQFHDP